MDMQKLSGVLAWQWTADLAVWLLFKEYPPSHQAQKPL